MSTDYEKNHLSESKNPSSILITKEMSESERNLEILRYLKEAIRNQPTYCERDIDICDALINKLQVENECNFAWENYFPKRLGKLLNRKG